MSAVAKDGPERDLPPGLALAWGETPASRRGPKPGYSVERIVEAAVELADREGFAALSLPRIARRVGFTTNALYRYVSSKDELLVLLADAGWGPPPDSLSRIRRWRAAATAWVRAVIERYHERPWLLSIPVRGAPVTPNLLRWLEVLLAGMAHSGLRDGDKLGCALLLDGYARGTAALSRDLREAGTPPVQSSAVTEFLQPRLSARGYPILATMLAGGRYEDTPADHDVEFGLGRILDGIDALIAQSPRRDHPR